MDVEEVEGHAPSKYKVQSTNEIIRDSNGPKKQQFVPAGGRRQEAGGRRWAECSFFFVQEWLSSRTNHPHSLTQKPSRQRAFISISLSSKYCCNVLRLVKPDLSDQGGQDVQISSSLSSATDSLELQVQVQVRSDEDFHLVISQKSWR